MQRGGREKRDFNPSSVYFSCYRAWWHFYPHLSYLLFTHFAGKILQRIMHARGSVVDPDWVSMRVQTSILGQCGSGTGSWDLMTKDCKILATLQIFFIPRPVWRTSKLQEKHSAPQKEHPELQNHLFLRFFSLFVGHFLSICGSGSSQDKYQKNNDPRGSGSKALVRRL